MKKILIISDENQEDLINLIGSEALRIKSHADNLFVDFAIDVFSRNSKKNHKRGNINFLNVTDDFIFDNIHFYEAVLLFQNSHFASFTFKFVKRNLKIKTIIDLYNPLILEKLTYSSNFRMNEVVEVVKKIINFGDYYLCSNLSQKTYYLGFLSVVGKIQKGDIDAQNIAVVPTVLDKYIQKNESANRPRDFVFFGGFYPWFDQYIANKFVEKVIAEGKNITFFGIKNPSVKGQFLNKAVGIHNSYALVKSKKVFFEDWVSNEKISFELRKYKIAVNFVQNSTEDIFAYRTRFLSLLQNGVPIVTNGKDEISRLIIRKNAGNEYDQSKNISEYLTNLEEKSKNAMMLFDLLNTVELAEKNKIIEFIKRNKLLRKNAVGMGEVYKKIVFFIRKHLI